MRSFSALQAHCSHAEELEVIHPPSRRLREAGDHGTAFHGAACEWIEATVKGAPFFDGGYTPKVRRQLNRLRGVWTPPKGIETELAVGLEEVAGEPRFVNVRETAKDSHIYVPVLPGHNLLCAGRADWVWDEPGEPLLVNVVDVKSGKFWLGDPDRHVQILAQGFACALRCGAVGFRPGIYYPLAGAFYWERPVSVLDTDAWRRVREAALRDSGPKPGAWCMGCWESPHRDTRHRQGHCKHSAVEDEK